MVNRQNFISAYATGRNNNFNLIRLIAATLVLVTHSFAIAIGTGDAEPLRGRLGMTLGDIAVDVFFVTSGFLVSGSILRSKNSLDFIRARCLRIFPALWVMLFLMVYVVGVAITSLPPSSYLSNPGTYIYFLKSASIVTGVGWVLPGVFSINPYKEIVNGSLWTLPYEVGMYFAIFIIWVFSNRRVGRNNFFYGLIVSMVFLIALGTVIHAKFLGAGSFALQKLTYMFFTGVVLNYFQERILLSSAPIFLGIVLGLLGVLF